MAWEDFNRNGIEGISGDKPIDEMSLALKRIVTAYENRYERKPNMTEIVYALETVITANPSAYVSDSRGLSLGEIIINRKTELVDITEYEAFFTDETTPGYHLINKLVPTEQPVINISYLEVKDNVLACHYKILAHDITDKIVETLILSVLLHDYCDQYYEDKAGSIQFVNTVTKTQWVIAYP
ncbi:MAG: hypothetical protein KAG20_06400 [Cocleimonas sp.]|nr:hypothetical protein [Cocleimonas sp.]